MTKVKAGKIIRVDNKERKFGANPEYLAIWVENNLMTNFVFCLLKEN